MPTSCRVALSALLLLALCWTGECIGCELLGARGRGSVGGCISAAHPSFACPRLAPWHAGAHAQSGCKGNVDWDVGAEDDEFTTVPRPDGGANTGSSSPADCCALCELDPLCEAWVIADGKCSLKGQGAVSAQGFTFRSGAVSGTKTQATPGAGHSSEMRVCGRTVVVRSLALRQGVKCCCSECVLPC